MEYPKVKKDCTAFVIVSLKNGRKIKAMFYYNGKEPRFASYGSNVTNEVVSWEYRQTANNRLQAVFLQKGVLKMNRQVKVKDLLAFCKQAIKDGHGEKNIVLSDDNEGNGYHGMFYGFTEVDEYVEDDIYDSHTNSPKDTIILG